jgi:hypothetical protein
MLRSGSQDMKNMGFTTCFQETPISTSFVFKLRLELLAVVVSANAVGR